MIRKVIQAIAIAVVMNQSVMAEQPLSQSFELADTEAAALVRIANEIERLLPLIAQAESVSDPSRRLKVNYTWLRKDLNVIKHGLEDAAFGASDATPRPVESLRGQYAN